MYRSIFYKRVCGYLSIWDDWENEAWRGHGAVSLVPSDLVAHRWRAPLSQVKNSSDVLLFYRD